MPWTRCSRWHIWQEHVVFPICVVQGRRCRCRLTWDDSALVVVSWVIRISFLRGGLVGLGELVWAAMAMLAAVVVVVAALMAAAFYSHVDSNAPIDAVALSFSGPYPRLEGVYARNTLLQSAEKLGAGQLLQPEDLVLDPSRTFLYAATSDGWIKKLFLHDGSVQDWHRLGGRPLGLVLGNHGELIVCASDQGLLNVTDEGVEVLATEAEGVKLLVTDGAAVTKDGLIYFTDASVKHKLENFVLDNLEGRPNGRILVYDPVSKTTQVVLKGLYFPNGIALSKDEHHLIFTETGLARLVKYHLKGANKGTTEIFNDKLPGFPDNLHYNHEKGIFYVGIVGQRDALADFLWKTPFAKKLLTLFPSILAAVNSNTKTARVLALDEDGNPLKMYQDPTGKVVAFVTCALEVDGYLYLGGLRDDFVGRIPV